MLEQLVASVIGVSLIVYALMGGADFGGGVWDLLARGPRAESQRHAIAKAIGPIWEADHVWLILVVVLLFSGFPAAFSTMMIALHIPITLMLLGIVVRGSTFVFREYGGDDRILSRTLGRLFGVACVFTPITQGMVLGALATGKIRVVDGHVTTGFLAGWLTPFAFGCGLFALALFAFLAATYLTLDTKDDPLLQNDFRVRALTSGALLGPIALAVLLAAGRDAPQLFRDTTKWWAVWVAAAASVFAVTTLVALWRRYYQVARATAIAQVVCILTGWMLSQYPQLVAPDVTIASARAPDVTLRLLVIALIIGGAILLPSLAVLFRLFKGART